MSFIVSCSVLVSSIVAFLFSFVFRHFSLSLLQPDRFWISETLSPLRRICPMSVSRCFHCRFESLHTQWPSRLLVVGLGNLANLDGVVEDEVHEFVKALSCTSVFGPRLLRLSTHANLALDTDTELLIQPNANGRVLYPVSLNSPARLAAPCSYASDSRLGSVSGCHRPYPTSRNKHKVGNESGVWHAL